MMNKSEMHDEDVQQEIDQKLWARDLKVRKYVDGVRQLADWYEAHPEMPVPFNTSFIWTYDRKEFLPAVQVLCKGGNVTKEISAREDGDYTATREFGAVSVRVSIPRKLICTLVQPAVYDCPESLLEEAKEYSEA